MAKIVLTADKSLMVSFPSTMYAGFLSCFPTKIVPNFIYDRVIPPVKANRDGTTDFPTSPLRQVESICVHSGFPRKDLLIAHPSHLKKTIKKDTEIVGVTVVDPLGIGPETTFWSTVLGGVPHNKVKFSLLMREIKKLKERYQFQVVLGGPGAWQLIDEDIMNEYGVDYVVIGEGENVVPRLFGDVTDGNLPEKRIHSGRIADAKQVPPILGPTNTSIIEIARGCGRGCQFCAPNVAGKLRSFPMEKILADAKVYLEAGSRVVTLHSEDTLRYGSKGLLADEDALLSLYKSLFSAGMKGIFITHANLTTFAYQPDLIEKLTKLLRAEGIPGYGGQVGLETGSSKLMRKYMKGKCLPLPPDEWQQVVKDGLEVMERNRWIACCTVLMGLPDEDDDDVKQTIQLIREVDNRFAFYFPLFFVPISTTPLRTGRRFVAEHASPEHWRLILECWRHNVRYAYKAYTLASEGRYPILRLGLRVGIKILYSLIQATGRKMIKKKNQLNRGHL